MALQFVRVNYAQAKSVVYSRRDFNKPVGAAGLCVANYVHLSAYMMTASTKSVGSWNCTHAKHVYRLARKKDNGCLVKIDTGLRESMSKWQSRIMKLFSGGLPRANPCKTVAFDLIPPDLATATCRKSLLHCSFR